MDAIKDFNFSSKVNVVIEVKGFVGDELAEMFSGVKVKHKNIDGVVMSLIEGEVTDQAALIGVLNTLYNKRCSIIKVVKK